MDKRIFLTLAVVLTVALSVSTIYASDVNVTDCDGFLDNVAVEDCDDASVLRTTEYGEDNLSEGLDDTNTLTSDNESNNSSSAINLSKTVTAKDVTKYYKGSAKYTVTFLNKNGNPLANTNVKITLNKVVYNKKTDGKGVVSLNINLKPGTYKIVATNPDTSYSLTNNVKILSTVVSADISKVYADGRKFTATFLKSNGKALANKQVKFKIKGKTYKVKTNSKGKASLSLTGLSKGTYKIISYNTDGLTKINKIKVVKSAKTSLKSKDYIFLTKDNKMVKVKLLNEFGYALPKGKVVTFKIGDKKYVGKTSKNGDVGFKLPSLKAGVYKVKFIFSKSGYYKGSSVNHMITIIPTKNPTFTVKSTTKFYYGAGTPFQVALTSGNIPLANEKITLGVDGQSYTKTTNSKGIASLPINLKVGNYTIKYSNKASSKVNAKSGSTPITVVKIESISIKNVIAGAKTLNSYYESNKKLPSSVTAGGVTFTMPEFLYVMSKTIVELGSSKTDDVHIIYGVKAPISPSGDVINSAELYKKDYITVANNTAKGIEYNNQAQNYANSAVGKIIYDELIHGFSSILTFYGNNNNQLPNYCIINYKIDGPSSQMGVGLNDKNTVNDTSIYLKATRNCEVGNYKIKSEVNSLVNESASKLENVEAIYNYVRDSISYSEYDAQYGAVSTYDSKSGNCVDQAHLLIALYRTAGLPARYIEGACTFYGGNTRDYVWVQVLIGDYWYVADPTSSKNSFGNIVNWNANSFSYKGSYSSFP